MPELDRYDPGSGGGVPVGGAPTAPASVPPATAPKAPVLDIAPLRDAEVLLVERKQERTRQRANRQRIIRATTRTSGINL